MPYSDWPLDKLTARCSEESAKYRRAESSDAQYCFELWRRALSNQEPAALQHAYTVYEPQIRRWVYSHPQFHQTGEPAENFVSLAFSNFYLALRGRDLDTFASLARLLSYLKACVHTAIAQYERGQKLHSVSLDDHNPGSQPNLGAQVDAQLVWQRVCSVLSEQEDRQLARLVFVDGLKPADVVELWPERWKTAREVSVALQRIRRQLRSDPTLQQWAFQ